MGAWQTGRIVTWKDDGGFGFITPDGGGADVFFHVSGLAAAAPRPVGGEQVTYQVELDADRKPQAANVRLQRRWRPRLTWARAVGGLWLFGLTALAVGGVLPTWVPIHYGLASVAAFTAYALDKARAAAGARRVPERVLHLLELAGGWPGALLAQQHFRHKTRKVRFQVLFWLIVLVHIAVVTWWCLKVEGRRI